MNKRLNASIVIGGAITGSLRGALSTASKSLTQLGAETRRLSREQKTLGSSIQVFGRMGKNVDGLREKYGRVTMQLDKMRTATERLGRVERMRDANLAKRSQIRGQIVDTVALGMAASVPIRDAIALENAMLGVAKQLDGARDSSGKLTTKYFDMRDAIQQLGRELPVSTNAIAEMVTAGLRMGVASDQVLEFVRRSAEMSTAFEIDEGELADKMGKIAGLYGIPITAIGQLGDSINWLDDNTKSTGAGIIDYLTRVGGVASAVKITGGEMAALGSTLETLGERTETAGTATNAMFQKFAAAEKGTKKFRSAMAEIGLSTSAVQAGMQTDAMGTLLKVLDQVNKLPAAKRLGVLTELVGLEHSDTMAKLATNTGELRKQLELTNSEAAKGSMWREFQARQETTSAQLQLTKNRMVELSATIGGSLLPTINSMVQAVGPVVSSFAEWSKEHPVLMKGITTLGVGLVGLRIASLAFGYGLTFVRGAIIAVGRAMLMNPIGAAVAVIAGGAYLIYKNWEPISAWFKDTWGMVTAAASKTWDWFKTNLSWHPLALVANNWEPLKGYFNGLWADITGTFSKALEWITSKIAWVGDTWRDTKSFFGLGDDEASANSPTRAGSITAPKFDAPVYNEPSALPAPAIASGRGGQTVNDQRTIHMEVHAAPGMSPEQVADIAVKKMERKSDIRGRAALFDGAYAQ